MIAVCRPEEKKVTYAISNRNDEVKKKQVEARKLLDEIAREIELTCGQGKSCWLLNHERHWDWPVKGILYIITSVP